MPYLSGQTCIAIALIDSERDVSRMMNALRKCYEGCKMITGGGDKKDMPVHPSL